MSSNVHYTGSRHGFTLVEIMVSMAVLVLMLAMVTQLINSTMFVSNTETRHMAGDSQARLVFDRMSLDFARMIKSPDLDSIWYKSTTAANTGYSDQFYFYSDAPGYFSSTAAPSTGSLVGYRINSEFQLERLAKSLTLGIGSTLGVGTTPGTMVYLSYPAAADISGLNSSPYALSTLAGHWATALGQQIPPNNQAKANPTYSVTGNLAVTSTGGPGSTTTEQAYHVLADGVFRLDYCFLMKPHGSYGGGYALGGAYPGDPEDQRDHTQGFKDVAAVVVTIVSLDAASRQVVPSMNNLAEAYAPRAENPQRLLTTTRLPTNTTNLAAVVTDWFGVNPSVPTVARAQIRVYQRFFYLNSSTTTD